MSSSVKPFLAVTLANVLFGTGYPLFKVVTAHMNPIEWIFIRNLFAGFILVFLYRKQLFSTKVDLLDWLGIGIAAFFGVVLNQIFFARGLSITTPAHAAIINATIPLQTLIFGTLFLRETLSPRKILGVILGFVGIAVLLRLDHLDFSNPLLSGDLFIVGNAFSYGIFFVLAKRSLKNIPTEVLLTSITLFGSLGIGAYVDWKIPPLWNMHLSWLVWASIAFLAVVQPIMAQGLNLWALKRVESSTAALFVYMQPLSAAILAFFLLGDVPGKRFYISAALILTGLLLGNFKKRAFSVSG